LRKEFAQLAKVPKSYSQFQELRPNLAVRLQNASAFKSDEATRYLEHAERLVANADGNFTAKNFEIALSNLLEANQTLARAIEAERAFVQSRQVTGSATAAITSQLILSVAVASVVVILIIFGLLRVTRRKAGGLAKHIIEAPRASTLPPPPRSGSCPKCGTISAPTADYCSECGTELT
jgi:hypothetical protein